MAQQFPNLAGCVPAGLDKRILRAVLLGVFAYVLYFVFSVLCGRMGIAGMVILAVVLLAFVVVQGLMMTKTGMSLPDYITKTKWVDATTGKPISGKGMAKLFLVLDGAPPLIVLIQSCIGLFGMVTTENFSHSEYDNWFGASLILLGLMYLYAIGMVIASIITWAQIADDKATRRCWTDRLANAWVIDISRGRDPFPS